ncbi:MAG: helix-turn-helix transcriptional regulator [Clostridia bacterium]|nr:helix-turn-helix transcriptional regulator [Clostridia bacterium]
MAFSEELYALRKQKGLSQEQLAEELGVSRQAISKWENGTAMPETETLIALSRCFAVSLDVLVGNAVSENSPVEASSTRSQKCDRIRFLGIVLLVVGAICLALLLAFRLLAPDASAEIAQSSTVILDGNGILMALCAAILAFGAFLFLKPLKK